MPEVQSFGQQPGLDVSIGPTVQAPVPAAVHGLASTVAASGSITSNLIPSDGYKVIAVGVTSTQAGQIQVQRYLDDAGTVKQGPALTASLTATTAGVCNVTDGNPFASFAVTITNTGGSSATLTNLGILLQGD
jgi:hypothetical protein